MGERPWLLIDVDGVLNPLVVCDGFEIYEMAPIGWTGPMLNVQLSERHGEWIRGLTDIFDLVWATTWEDSANLMISPKVGLPNDLPVIPFREPRLRYEWGISFKSPAVAHYVGSHPFVWLDDSLTPADTDWFSRVSGIGQFHLQSIDPLVGLTAADIAEVRAWGESPEPLPAPERRACGAIQSTV